MFSKVGVDLVFFLCLLERGYSYVEVGLGVGVLRVEL